MKKEEKLALLESLESLVAIRNKTREELEDLQRRLSSTNKKINKIVDSLPADEDPA